MMRTETTGRVTSKHCVDATQLCREPSRLEPAADSTRNSISGKRATNRDTRMGSRAVGFDRCRAWRSPTSVNGDRLPA